MKGIVRAVLVILCMLVAGNVMGGGPQAAAKAAPKLQGVLNINTATVEELQMLPGIGPAIAKDIVKYRTEKGPFKALADLDKVKGIGKQKLEGVRPYCALEGASTLKVMK